MQFTITHSNDLAVCSFCFFWLVFNEMVISKICDVIARDNNSLKYE